MAIHWPTPDFKGRTFELWALNRWVFNICVCSAPMNVRHFDWTFIHAELSLFSLVLSKFFKSLFNKEFFFGTKKVSQNISNTPNNSFYQIYSFLWSQLSMSARNIPPWWWMTSPVQYKSSALSSSTLWTLILPENPDGRDDFNMGIMVQYNGLNWR